MERTSQSSQVLYVGPVIHYTIQCILHFGVLSTGAFDHRIEGHQPAESLKDKFNSHGRSPSIEKQTRRQQQRQQKKRQQQQQDNNQPNAFNKKWKD
jgi:hypothetical protein